MGTSENHSDSGDGGEFECDICGDSFDSKSELKAHKIKKHKEKVCSYCGDSFLSNMPYKCKFCGEIFCSDHRLPENHNCSKLGSQKKKNPKNWFSTSSGRDVTGGESKKTPSVGLKSSGPVMNRIRRFYYNYVRNYKIVSIIGLVLLFAIIVHQSPGTLEGTGITSGNLTAKLNTAFNELKSSFELSSKLNFAFTIILIVTIWTGFKYWLKDLGPIRRNSKLLEKLIIVLIFILFTTRHIRFDSVVGFYADWAIFLMLLYFVVAGTWFLAKTIDAIDLSSDLYCWGLRILGSLVVFFGVVFLFSTGVALVISDSDLLTENIYWIASVCLIFLGLFMNYRSFRRHPAIHVW